MSLQKHAVGLTTLCREKGATEEELTVCKPRRRSKRHAAYNTIYFEGRSIAISVFVCLSACLSVCMSYLKNHMSHFYGSVYMCYLWPWLGFPLTTVQYTFMLPVLRMTSYFHIMGPKGQNQARRYVSPNLSGVVISHRAVNVDCAMRNSVK